MADSVTGFERSIDSTGYTPFSGVERGTADRHPRSVLPIDASVSAQNELASLLRLATQKQEAGDEAGAEEFFRKALEMADRTLGPDHPELMLLLTDLTRLHLRKSAFSAAEPLLLRMLEMKRAKGEDHPEVATVLANLANVRQALGRHESAEQLWRRVLDIRERTLAPNHFAIATALERLGDACAARGKIGEALSTFQRALAIRERTLGGEHPSLRVSRERIADLQLQASEDPLDPGAGSETPVTPERFRLISGESVAPTAPTPSVREKLSAPVPTSVREKLSAPLPRKSSVIIHRQVAEPTATADERPVTSVAATSGAPSPSFDAADMGSAVLPEPLPFRDALESLREEMEKPYSPDGFGERGEELLGTLLTFLSKKQVIAGTVAVVISLLLVVVVTDSRAFGERDQTTAFASSAYESPRVTAAPVPASGVTTSEPNVAVAGAASGSKAAPPRARVVEEKPAAAKKAPEKKSEPKLAIPTFSTAAMSRLDSAAARAASAAARAGDPIVAVAPNPLTTGHSTFGDNDQSTTPQRARLIGDLPTPRVPNQVADVEGEVRVRFNVDTDGRPVMTTFEVVNSPNPLLTTAVRKVIPGMRFEPARTGGPDAKPIVDVVQIGFQFSRRE